MRNITHITHAPGSTWRTLAVCSAILGAALLLSGCTKGESGSAMPAPNDTSTNTATPTPTPGTPTEPKNATSVNRDAWVAAWTSPSCGDRKYTRVLSLAADGSVSGEERVSPCPKGVTCVWSGIIQVTGSYDVQGDVATLTLKPNTRQPKTPTLPQKLMWDSSAGAPVEVQGDARCVYQRP